MWEQDIWKAKMAGHARRRAPTLYETDALDKCDRDLLPKVPIFPKLLAELDTENTKYTFLEHDG